MKYFLDFDRTVFDTVSFKKALKRRPTVLELVHQLKMSIQEILSPTHPAGRRSTFLKTLGTFLSHGRFAFTPEELRQFLYPEVPEFLQSHDCTIVTYGVRAFITAKVTTALTDLPLVDIVYTSRKKGRTIERLSREVKTGCTFVDDAIFQLESVTAYCPTVTVIEMRRDDRPGDGRWDVIHSLSDLVALKNK
jgi:hypothetical protein